MHVPGARFDANICRYVIDRLPEGIEEYDAE